MAYGDVGGSITELIITCRTPRTGEIHIVRGDALALTGPYTVAHPGSASDPVFGQAMADVNLNDAPLPVRVRGICPFRYTGSVAPSVNGISGVVAGSTPGSVSAPSQGSGKGLNVSLNTSAKTVDVLL